MSYTLSDYRKRVAKLLNFQTGTPNQDFDGGTSATQYAEVDEYIHLARMDEWAQAVDDVGTLPFVTVTQLTTWPASQVTYTLPANISAERIRSLYDVTGESRGYVLWTTERSDSNSDLFWRDRHTLQWGVTGPPQNTTIDCEYAVMPSYLSAPNQIEDVFPEQHQHLIPWAAAIFGKTAIGDPVPQGWTQVAENLRMSMHKFLSMARPRMGGPGRSSGVTYNMVF